VFTFASGGFQEARGDCRAGGGLFFIDNQFELLDTENEYFLDIYSANPQLYYQTSSDPTAKTFELTVARSFFNVVGSATMTSATPVTDVVVRGINFEMTYPTHMDAFEVPSGGDWSITRQGAIFLETVERVNVTDCTFAYLGGNGIFVSGYARDVALSYNSFFALGGTALLTVGNPKYYDAMPWDMTHEIRYPVNTVISHSWARNFGLAVAQSAAVFVSISYRTAVSHCVFHNGPRSGVNINDGFLGGQLISHTILFNLVQLTLDHGPINAWDRQRWLLPFAQELNQVNDNMLIGNPNGALGVDLDDGSQFYLAQRNIIVFGTQKLKGNDNAYNGNLVFFPLLESSAGGRGCALLVTPNNQQPHFSVTNCLCVSTSEPIAYHARWIQAGMTCNLPQLTLSDNRYYATKFFKCNRVSSTPALSGFLKWKSSGQDKNSVFSTALPDLNTMLAWMRAFNAP